MHKERQTIKQILRHLYVECKDGQYTVNPDKEWSPDTVDKIATTLHTAGYTPESAVAMTPEDQIQSVWDIDDVKSQASNEWPCMSDNVARYILTSIDRNHDANVGISWEVIDSVISSELWNIRTLAGHNSQGALHMDADDAMDILEGLCEGHDNSVRRCLNPAAINQLVKQWTEQDKENAGA